MTKSPDFWSTLQRLHQHKTEAERVFDILTLLSSASPIPNDQALTADNFESAISLANDFASAGSIGSIQEKRRDFAAKQGRKAKDAKPEDTALVQRANKAVSLIYQLTERVPGLIEQSHLERAEAWAAYWSPVFRALGSQCVNPCREVRYRATSALQRTLLSESVADEKVQKGQEHTEWTAIFDEVLFPLTLRLLKPEIYQLDPAGMNETRAQMGGLLCKIFLRYLDRLYEIPLVDKDDDREDDEEEEEEGEADEKSGGPSDDQATKEQQSPNQTTSPAPWATKMADVWIKTLELLDRLMNAGTIDPQSQQGDALAEAVREGVKNTLLVMDGAGYLGRNDNTNTSALRSPTAARSEDAPAKREIWPETVRRLDRFLPGLVGELFAPDEVPPSTAAGGSGGDASAAEDKKPQSAAAGVAGVAAQGSASRPQTRDGEGSMK